MDIDLGDTPQEAGQESSTQKDDHWGTNSPEHQNSPDDEDMLILSAVGEESVGSTPENWQQRYDLYLQDSPITPKKRPESSKDHSPTTQDRIKSQLASMHRRAEYFFQRTATTNLPTEGEVQTSLDRRAKAEETVQWARLMNYDEILVDAQVFFNTLGVTTPSIDAATMAELVMGQYDLAKRRGDECWLRGARQSAILFFPINWVDSHLQRFTEGKPLVTRRHKPSATIPAMSAMPKDWRVTEGGQDLPTARFSVAASENVPEDPTSSRDKSRDSKTTNSPGDGNGIRGKPQQQGSSRLRHSQDGTQHRERRRTPTRRDSSPSQRSRRGQELSSSRSRPKNHRSPVRPPSSDILGIF